MSDLTNPAFKTFVARAIDTGVRYSDFVRDVKRAFIQEELDRAHGNQSRAARELGMHRNTLQRTMHELNIPSPAHRERGASAA